MYYEIDEDVVSAYRKLYSKNEAQGTDIYRKADSLYSNGEIERALSHYQIAHARYSECSRLIAKNPTLGSEMDIARKLEMVERGIDKCQSKIAGQSRAI